VELFHHLRICKEQLIHGKIHYSMLELVFHFVAAMLIQIRSFPPFTSSVLLEAALRMGFLLLGASEPEFVLKPTSI
jgi:hypothetical protein